MNDLISRSKVLDLLYKIFEEYNMTTDKTSDLKSFGTDVFKAIKDMPTDYSNCHGNIKKIEITNKAVEKQIPKKLIRRRATDDDVENELRDFITCKGEICRCPACGDCIAIYELKYCMECGQRLDWGTESE